MLALLYWQDGPTSTVELVHLQVPSYCATPTLLHVAALLYWQDGPTPVSGLVHTVVVLVVDVNVVVVFVVVVVVFVVVVVVVVVSGGWQKSHGFCSSADNFLRTSN